MSNWSFVIAAYVVTWTAVTGYAVTLVRRRRRLLRERQGDQR